MRRHAAVPACSNAPRDSTQGADAEDKTARRREMEGRQRKKKTAIETQSTQAALAAAEGGGS
eukprot:2422498-Rhodomonas_salina.1